MRSGVKAYGKKESPEFILLWEIASANQIFRRRRTAKDMAKVHVVWFSYQVDYVLVPLSLRAPPRSNDFMRYSVPA